MLGSLANDPFLSCLRLLVMTYFMASPAGEYISSHSLAGDYGFLNFASMLTVLFFRCSDKFIDDQITTSPNRISSSCPETSGDGTPPQIPTTRHNRILT